MDLRAYYSKIREIELEIAEEFPVVVSVDTVDGGRGGVLTEVTRRIAAKMIADGRARLGDDSERGEFLERKLEAKKSADQIASSSRMQVTVLTDKPARGRK